MIPQSFSLTCAQIRERFPSWVVEVIGDASRTITGVQSPASAALNQIAFCSAKQALQEGLASSAGALVIPPKERDRFAGSGPTLLLCERPESFMVDFMNELVLSTPYRSRTTSGVDPRAVVSPEAIVAASATVCPGAVVGAGARLGERCYVGYNAVIEPNASIGDDTVVHPLAYVGHSTQIGARCEIHANATVGKEGFGYATEPDGRLRKIPHVGRVVIEDDVHVGANCSIDRGTLEETRICARARLDNQIHIAHNCKVGFNSVLTACFAMAGSSQVGKFFLAGGRANVTGHVKVGDGVKIAALSAVSKDLPAPGEYGGVPLVPLQTFVKIKAAMVQLPEMRKQVAALRKAVFGDGATEHENSEPR